jgi:hypothetical protein
VGATHPQRQGTLRLESSRIKSMGPSRLFLNNNTSRWPPIRNVQRAPVQDVGPSLPLPAREHEVGTGCCAVAAHKLVFLGGAPAVVTVGTAPQCGPTP